MATMNFETPCASEDCVDKMIEDLSKGTGSPAGSQTYETVLKPTWRTVEPELTA